jgi:hypothetical protein
MAARWWPIPARNFLPTRARGLFAEVVRRIYRCAEGRWGVCVWSQLTLNYTPKLELVENVVAALAGAALGVAAVTLR